MELNQFLPPTSSDDICLLFCLILLLWCVLSRPGPAAVRPAGYELQWGGPHCRPADHPAHPQLQGRAQAPRQGLTQSGKQTNVEKSNEVNWDIVEDVVAEKWKYVG